MQIRGQCNGVINYYDYSVELTAYVVIFNTPSVQGL